MSDDKFKIDAGFGRTVVITQNISDLKEGIKQNDLSRISSYSGTDHVHTGTFTNTIFIDKGKK